MPLHPPEIYTLQAQRNWRLHVGTVALKRNSAERHLQFNSTQNKKQARHAVAGSDGYWAETVAE